MQNRVEDQRRREVFGSLNFAEKLHLLESQGRTLSQFAERAAQRLKALRG